MPELWVPDNWEERGQRSSANEPPRRALIATAAVTACSKEEPSTNEEVEQQTENMEPHRTIPVVVTSLSRKAQMYL